MNNQNRNFNPLSVLLNLVFISMIISASSASAGLITRADFSGSETLETFSDDFAAGASVLLNDVTYTSANSVLFKVTRDNFFPNVADISTGGSLNDNAADSDISVMFSTQVNRLGFYLTTGGNVDWLVDVFGDNDQLLGSNTYNSWGTNPSLGAAFVGFEFADNINHFRISQQSGSGNVFIMDDLRYEAANAVPEPSLLGLLAMGCLFLVRKRDLALA